MLGPSVRTVPCTGNRSVREAATVHADTSSMVICDLDKTGSGGCVRRSGYVKGVRVCSVQCMQTHPTWSSAIRSLDRSTGLRGGWTRARRAGYVKGVRVCSVQYMQTHPTWSSAIWTKPGLDACGVGKGVSPDGPQHRTPGPRPGAGLSRLHTSSQRETNTVTIPPAPAVLPAA